MVEQVVCSRCGEVKPRGEFIGKITNGALRDGRPRGYCRPCRAARKRERRREAGPVKVGRPFARRPTPADWPEHVWRRLEERNAREAWRHWIKVKAPDSWKRQYHLLRPWTLGGTSAEIYRWRCRNDPAFRSSERIRFKSRKRARGRHGEAIRAALRGKRSGTRLAKWLGYTMQELKAHLVGRFTEGMTWERFCRGEIHIDHIVPLAAFDMSDPVQVKAAWRLSNLQPMWPEANVKKGARYAPLKDGS